MSCFIENSTEKNLKASKPAVLYLFKIVTPKKNLMNFIYELVIKRHIDEGWFVCKCPLKI